MRIPFLGEAMNLLSNLLTVEEWNALWLSFKVAVCAAVLGLPFAVAIGYGLARSRIKGKWLVEVFVNLPLVLPPVVVGYLLLVCFSPRGPVGSLLEAWFGVRIVFTWLGAVLASVVVSFPLMVRAIRLTFQGIDPRLEMAARSLGASPLRSFLTVSLPLARRGLIGGVSWDSPGALGSSGRRSWLLGTSKDRLARSPWQSTVLTNQPGGMEQSWRLVGLAIAALACGALAVK